MPLCSNNGRCVDLVRNHLALRIDKYSILAIERDRSPLSNTTDSPIILRSLLYTH